MSIEGYDFGVEKLGELLLQKFFPEKTDHESALLLEFLRDYGATFDKLSFSVRVGQGLTPNPEHELGVQRATAFSSRRRIDFVGIQGTQATLVELKTRVGHAVMGQLLDDRLLWLKEFPDGPEPLLVAVGRYSTPEELENVTAHGITVLLYEAKGATGVSPGIVSGPGASSPA